MNKLYAWVVFLVLLSSCGVERGAGLEPAAAVSAAVPESQTERDAHRAPETAVTSFFRNGTGPLPE